MLRDAGAGGRRLHGPLRQVRGAVGHRAPRLRHDQVRSFPGSADGLHPRHPDSGLQGRCGEYEVVVKEHQLVDIPT